MADVPHKTELTQEQSDELLRRLVDGFSSPPRSPILHWPSEHSLEYEDITFPALDGVPIEAWSSPAPGSRKLIIATHPLGFTRSGIPTHLEPWYAAWAPSSNGFEVTLTDASDVQAMYDNIPVADKRLLWIENTTARWDGYMEFQRRPAPMLEWFDQHMA